MKVVRFADLCLAGFLRSEFSRFVRTITPRLEGCGLEFADACKEPLLQSTDRHLNPFPSEGALPHDSNSPTCLEELALRTVIPFDITLELGLPEVGPGGWCRRVTAPRMAVPETPVNKANGTVPTQDKIGFAREITNVESESESASVKCSSKGEFRFGVLARYACHHSRSRGLVDDVSHQLRGWLARSLRKPDFTRGQPQDQVVPRSMGNGDSAGAGLRFLCGIQRLQSERDLGHTHELPDIGVWPRFAGLVGGSTNDEAVRHQ